MGGQNGIESIDCDRASRDALFGILGEDYRKVSTLVDTLVHALPGGIAVYKIGKQVETLYSSEGIPRLSGRTMEEYLAWVDEDVFGNTVFEDDLPLMLQSVFDSVATGDPVNVTYRLKHKDGGLVWVRLSAVKIREEDDSSIYFATFTLPADEALLYRGIVEDSATGVLVAERASNKILYVNDTWRTLEHVPFGKNLMGIAVSEAVAPYVPILSRGDIDQLEPGMFREFHKTMDDGKQLLVKGRVLVWNGIESYVLYVVDQTTEYVYREQMENMLDRIPSGVSIFEIVGDKLNQVYVNDGFYRMLGTSRNKRAHYAGFSALDAAHPDDLPAIHETMKRVLAGDDYVECDYRIVNQQGGWTWMHLAGIVAERGEQRALCYASFVDVGNAKARERNYEERIRLMGALRGDVLAMAVHNLTRDTVANAESKNPDYLEIMSGKPSSDVLAAIAENIEDDAERASFLKCGTREALTNRYRQGETHVSVRHHVNGRSGWVETTFDLVVNPYSGDLEAIVVLHDIDDAIRAERIVRRLTQTDYDSIFTIDAKTGEPTPFSKEQLGIVLETQRRAGDNVRGVENLIRAYCIDEDIERVVQEMSLPYVLERLSEVSIHTTSYTLRMNDKVVHKRVGFMYLDDKKQTILCAIQDTTREWYRDERQRMQLRAALTDAQQASRAKSAFLSNMSHEIRTPMNAIMGMSRLARGVSGNPNQTLEYLEGIEGSGQYLLGVINDVLDMSRIESGKLDLQPSWTRPEEVLEACVRMLIPTMNEKGISFSHPDTSRIRNYEWYVDGLRVKQVLMNLLNNALKFTEPGGAISLTIRNIRHEGSHSVDLVEIADTGCGMSEEFMTRIFQPFEREDNGRVESSQGTGLGLALAKRIIEGMGGSLTVSSKLGEGSVFCLEVPYEWRFTEKRKGEREESSVQEEASLRGLTVLLVEDHPLNRLIARKLLEERGVLVREARDGRDAVEVFANSSPEEFDAVLMDVRMPRMDGIQATQAIRLLDRDDAKTTPIIAMTANAFEEDVRETLEAGMNEHLAKPVSPEALYAALARQTARRAGK